MADVNPETIESTIPRPGYKYPWVLVIQRDGDRWAWGVYSQGARSTRPFWSGHANTITKASAAAHVAVESGVRS